MANAIQLFVLLSVKMKHFFKKRMRITTKFWRNVSLLLHAYLYFFHVQIFNHTLMFFPPWKCFCNWQMVIANLNLVNDMIFCFYIKFHFFNVTVCYCMLLTSCWEAQYGGSIFVWFEWKYVILIFFHES